MSEFVDYLHEVFEEFGPISARRMFGGYGIYHEGLIFALVMDDTLYLKTDAQIRHFFAAEGLGPFEYRKDGKPTPMSYYRAPVNLFEDRELAAVWAGRSFAAALRKQTAKAQTKRSKPKS